MQTFMRAYYATITRLDFQIGTLIEQLHQSGHYDNTVIIFLSDNGYLLGNHGLGNKITMHEESVRVPMFIHGTQVKAKGLRSDALVSSLDVMPTVLDLAGVEKPAHLAGTSLVSLLEKPDNPLRDYVASECVGVGGKPGEGHRMIRTARWKYVLTDVNDAYLFDEQADPYEMKNLAALTEHRETLTVMEGFLRQWMDHVIDGHAKPPLPPK